MLMQCDWCRDERPAGLPRYQIVGQTRGRTGRDKGERESVMIGAIS